MSLDLTLKSLRVRATDRVLLNDLRLSIAHGAVHTLMGPSGCGKSSVLNAICGSLPPELAFEGEVSCNGRRLDSLPIQARRIGLLFQDDLLFAHMTVAENLLFAIPPGARAVRFETMRQALAELALSEYENADPATLSGGQRARISLMRTLLAKPDALLLDEPFSKFDANLRQRMRESVFTLARTRSIPVLLVTHDEADVADPALVTRLG